MNEALSRPGNYYAFGRVGILILIPSQRGIVYAYNAEKLTVVCAHSCALALDASCGGWGHTGPLLARRPQDRVLVLNTKGGDLVEVVNALAEEEEIAEREERPR